MAAPSAVPARLSLVEYRQDEQAKINEALSERIKDVSDKQDRIIQLLIGLLCSVTAASILMVINLARPH